MNIVSHWSWLCSIGVMWTNCFNRTGRRATLKNTWRRIWNRTHVANQQMLHCNIRFRIKLCNNFVTSFPKGRGTNLSCLRIALLVLKNPAVGLYMTSLRYLCEEKVLIISGLLSVLASCIIPKFELFLLSKTDTMPFLIGFQTFGYLTAILLTTDYNSHVSDSHFFSTLRSLKLRTKNNISTSN